MKLVKTTATTLTATATAAATARALPGRALRPVLAWLALLATLALTGCATAPGAQFAALQEPQADKAQLYLYRKSALYAFGAAYPVMNVSTQEKLGELVNASYLVLPLVPGKHTLSVDERGFTSAKTFDVQAQAGQTYFVEYDSSKGLLLGWGLLSGSAVKTKEQALVDLKDLKQAN